MFRNSKKSSPTGLMPMGQIGGPCFPPNVLMGVPKAHCGTATVTDPNLVCKNGFCQQKPFGPGGLPPAPSPGEGQRCLLPNQFPGSGLRGNCQSGLVCKTSGDLGVPICMKPTKSGMGSKEILTIIGLIFLGLCFLCGLAKMGMKDAKRKGNCDKACGAFVFLGVALIAVSSVMKSSN
jgi:hypothetical protein